MRVILLINSLFTGGAEFSSLQFYGWLKRKGYDVKLVVLKDVNLSYDPKRFGFEQAFTLEGNSFLSKLKSLKKLMREFKPEVVHSVLFEANLLGRLTRLSLGGFVHVESLVNEMYSEHRYADPQVTRVKLSLYRFVDWITQLKGVDHFHANGHAVAMHYHKKLRISMDRVTIIFRGRERNPLVKDDSNRKAIRESLGTGERLLLVNMARHEYQKGQDILLDALGMLKDQLGEVQLLIVGREGKLTPVLQQKVKEYQLQDNVVMVGHRNDANNILAAADVFVFPSRFEGLPGSLIEAEAASLPIICSDIPNNREIANELNALFFNVNQTTELASALKIMIVDTEKRNRMAGESLRLFTDRFQLESIHAQMEDFILKCLKRSK